MRINGFSAGDYEGKTDSEFRLAVLEKHKIILRCRVTMTLQHCKQDKVCVPNLCYMPVVSLLWLWDPIDPQFHIKFLFILALHAFVCAGVIGNPFTALLSSYPLYMLVYCTVLFVQSQFWAFFPNDHRVLEILSFLLLQNVNSCFGCLSI